MSSVPKVISLKAVNSSKLKTNQMQNQNFATKDYEYDSFTPSFKGKQSKFASGVKMALLAAMTALAATSCKKEEPLPPVPSNPNPTEQPTNGGHTTIVNVNQETNVTVTLSTEQIEAYLAEILEAINAGNAINQNILNELINGGVSMQTIIDYLEQNHQQLENLVHGQEDLTAILLDIKEIASHIESLGQAGNDLLNQILQAVLSLDANSNANHDAIVALINEILAQMENLNGQVGQMNEQQAANFAAIIEALNHMTQTMQAQLLAIMNAIHTLDANMQAGYQALLAQLNGMQSWQQNALMQLLGMLNNINGSINNLSANVIAKLNELIGQVNNMSQNMQSGIALLLAQLQNMQSWNQEALLELFNTFLSGRGRFRFCITMLLSLLHNKPRKFFV